MTVYWVALTILVIMAALGYLSFKDISRRRERGLKAGIYAYIVQTIGGLVAGVSVISVAPFLTVVFWLVASYSFYTVLHATYTLGTVHANSTKA
jgi:hypothetical protein